MRKIRDYIYQSSADFTKSMLWELKFIFFIYNSFYISFFFIYLFIFKRNIRKVTNRRRR